MLFSKFRVVQPSQRVPSSMFNSTEQNNVTLIPTARSSALRQNSHHTQCNGRAETGQLDNSLERPKSGRRRIKKTKQVFELSSRRWIGHERRKYTAKVGWKTCKNKEAETSTCVEWGLGTACLCQRRRGRSSGKRGRHIVKGPAVWTEHGSLSLSFTWLPDWVHVCKADHSELCFYS